MNTPNIGTKVVHSSYGVCEVVNVLNDRQVVIRTKSNLDIPCSVSDLKQYLVD